MTKGLSDSLNVSRMIHRSMPRGRDLEREMKRGAGKAQAFLRENPAALACIPWTVAGEFAEGFADIRDPVCTAMPGRFEMVPMDEATAGQYARITAKLRREIQLIGTNDLWIAAAALAHGLEPGGRIAHGHRPPLQGDSWACDGGSFAGPYGAFQNTVFLSPISKTSSAPDMMSV